MWDHCYFFCAKRIRRAVKSVARFECTQEAYSPPASPRLRHGFQRGSASGSAARLTFSPPACPTQRQRGSASASASAARLTFSPPTSPTSRHSLNRGSASGERFWPDCYKKLVKDLMWKARDRRETTYQQDRSRQDPGWRRRCLPEWQQQLQSWLS